MTTEARTAARPAAAAAGSPLDSRDGFVARHIGLRPEDEREMLAALGLGSLDGLLAEVVPDSIRSPGPLELVGPAGPDERSAREALASIRAIAEKNQVFRSCIGAGYHGTITPTPILRSVLECPAWYTPYTPYQAEISQGRLEALLNFQTMVIELTGLEIANASLLDEATAAAEAMTMCLNVAADAPRRFLVAADCHPQTIAVLRTRAEPLGVELIVKPHDALDPAADGGCAGVLVQYPATDGTARDYRGLAERTRAAGALLVAAADPLALCVLTPPGAWGADVAVGSVQRFGVPMGFGGPHAAYLATHEKHARKLPGRLVGVSKDSAGNRALRLTLQTREQHIRRDRATSNICTAQALLATIASMYACFHGPEGLRRIAERTRAYTLALRQGLTELGCEVLTAAAPGETLFDTVRVRPRGRTASEVVVAALARRINLRDFGDGTLGVTLDETADRALVADVLASFKMGPPPPADELLARADGEIPAPLRRETPPLAHPVFTRCQSETELIRYVYELQNKDITLAQGMIPLGSCTMKLNAAAEMVPVTWPEFAELHPHCPPDQAAGYAELAEQLRAWLGEITGFPAVSLQPNAGSQGEYAGLLAIRGYHRARGEHARDVCLVPESAHGTNAASAVMAGMRVVAVKNRADGAIDLDDLRDKVEQHAGALAALMVTYPSTCGVFDDNIRSICAVVHEHGGQVYMDGANMNAQVGLCKPAEIGADVVHLNLHKTFCIPHGGGGPGMGPIAAARHLEPFLPSERPDAAGGIGMVSAAAIGSASILPISWMYVVMMGAEGLRLASAAAILAANYMAERLKDHYPVLFRGAKGRVAHEFVLDCRPFKKSAGVEIDDIAKRLMDHGFHAPTMSWPVPGTLMVEPTESESKAELDAFCDAMIAIADEIKAVERGDLPRDDNPLKHAPHTAESVAADEWPHAYPREAAAYPSPRVRGKKYWPPVGRVNNAHGDRNLVCACPPLASLAES